MPVKKIYKRRTEKTSVKVPKKGTTANRSDANALLDDMRRRFPKSGEKNQ